MALPSLGKLGAKFSEMSFPHFKTYCKIPKISPSKNKLPKLATQRHLCYVAPPGISPWGLTLETVLKYKKQTKQKLLRVPK